MKVFELKIDEDDELSGVNLLSLVADPATRISWEIFNNDEPHDCSLHEQDFSNEELKVLQSFGEEMNPLHLQGAKITPVEIKYVNNKFVAVPPITSNPRRFDLASADSEEGDAITRYVYVVDTALGSPLIRTSRPLCRSMIRANRVYSRTDINNLSQALSSSGDSFKLVYRKNIYNSVDFWQYKAGKYCRHRWFQIEFPVSTNETFDDALSKVPVKANQALGKGIQLGGGASRPFQSEWSILPPGKTQGFSNQESMDAIAFHFGLFFYSSRFAALQAEPMAKVITKVKLCYYQDECVYGWCPVDIMPEYFEGTAEVIEKFQVRQNFSVVPDYIREAAKRAVDYAEENGWGDCGTDVGKRRANDLADGSYNASLDVLSRMYSYGSRHKVDWDASKDIEDGCGYLMMLSWGFTPSNYDSAMNWLENEIKKATEMNVAMTADELKGEITAVVFQPNQKIFRWDAQTQSPYYVFMTKETIKKALKKVSRLKPKNFINFEHSGMVFSGDDVYTYENWLVGDNPKMDKSYQIFGREFEAGTWLTSIAFKNRKLFDDFVVSNKTSGISLEGLFEEVPFNFFDMKKEEFVKPSPAETQDDFVARCVPVLMGEGKTQDEALGACYGMYETYAGFDFPKGTCWEGYEPYGTKIVDGREVPNCVPIKASADYDEILEDKDMIDGVVELLLQIEDLENRYTIAKDVVRDFAIEGVAYDMDDFINRIGLMGYAFAPYPFNECINDQLERGYSEEVAQKICGKIRSENMGMIGIDGGIPIYADEYEAKEAASKLGCEGAHQMDGGWAPCSSHEDAINLYDANIAMKVLEEMLNKIDEGRSNFS